MCVTFELRFPTNQQVSSFFSVCVCLLCVLENSFTFRLKCRKCHYNSSLFLSGRISFFFSFQMSFFLFLCSPLLNYFWEYASDFFTRGLLLIMNESVCTFPFLNLDILVQCTPNILRFLSEDFYLLIQIDTQFLNECRKLISLLEWQYKFNLQKQSSKK